MVSKNNIESKLKIGSIILILIILAAVIIGALIYLNNDEARIQDCLDRFALACSNGNFKKAASCCTGATKATFKAANSFKLSYKGFGTNYGSLASLIMPISGESMKIDVKDIDFNGHSAEVDIILTSKNKSSEHTENETVKMVKVYGLFWKIQEI